MTFNIKLGQTLLISSILLVANSCGCPTFNDYVVFSDLEHKNKFIIPRQFKVLEEYRGKVLYNCCIKFSTTDMNKFIIDNRHLFKDTLLSKVIKPTTFVLLSDNIPQTDGSLIHYRTENIELYADSTNGKLYVSKFY